MRKLLIAFVAVLVTTFLVITLMPWGLPQNVPNQAICGKGDIRWVVENRIFYTHLYRMEQDKVMAFYRCSRVQNHEVATAVAASGSDTGPCVVFDLPTHHVWQISAVDSLAHTPAPFPYQEGDILLDYHMDGTLSYLTVQNAAGTVQVFCAEQDSWRMILLQEAPEAGRVEAACYRENTLTLRLSGGQAIAVTSTGIQSVDASAQGDSDTLDDSSIPFSIRLACKALIYCFAGGALLFLFGLAVLVFMVLNRSRTLSTRTLVVVLASLLPASCVFCGVLFVQAFQSLGAAVLPMLLLRMSLSVVVFITAIGLLLHILLRRLTQPLGVLATQMERVADGDLTLREIPCQKDELGRFHSSLQELCMSLSIRDYEVNSTMRSYHRFVPTGLEALLDRASVMEVGLGDSRAIAGNVGIFSVCNRQDARQCSNDDDYISFLSDSTSLMDNAVRTHEGLLLSTGYDMAEDRVFFPGKSGDGIRAGLDLLGAAGARSSESHILTPQFFLLLHKTTFLYGIAGSEENLFPFLSSSELEFLGSYADRLYATGARIVLTEPFMHQLSGNHLTRYIGFVSSSDGQSSFKLYEVLEAYSDLERNLRIRYDRQLQEGIALFYHSDYYLARNIFSSILRICPSDGIARFYLFACEHFFHCADNEAANYQLFGFTLD